MYFDGTATQRTGRYAWVETKQLKALLGEDDLVADSFRNIRHYRNGKFLGIKNAKIRHDGGGTRIILPDDPGYGSDAGASPPRINFPNLPDSAFYPDGYLISNHDYLPWNIDDVIFGKDVKVDIEERHITVIKPKPLNTLSVKINHTENATSTSNIPNLFETKFPRFSYRYKYRDGEYSAFAPFTAPVFNPKYPKDTGLSVDTSVFYNKDNAYDIKEPYNKAMVNSIHSVDLSDFIDAQTPEDVIEIDILYKQEESNVIYSIDTIKHSDKEWHSISNHEGVGLDLGAGKSNQASGTYETEGGSTKGRYLVTTENIYAALPANQLLRPWDNVPKKALAQEVTGNRIVYGNYVQNYDLVNNTSVSISYDDRKNSIGSFVTQGLPSIKSQRNYQLGVIYCDKYGRETPVFTSKTGAINVPWQDSNGNKNASRSTQLGASVATNFPEWVDSLKFFIKETSNPYYNLTMDRAWVTKSTYELDDSEGHLWISFPSSDRNKISEEDYIILKKKIGTGEDQVSFENKYKVIDIKNEAPDALKYQLVNYGAVHNNGNYFNDLFPNGYRRIDREVNFIRMDIDKWVNRGDSGGPFEVLGQIPLEEDRDNTTQLKTKDLYMSWRRIGVDINSASKKYKITGGHKDSAADEYRLKLSTKITKIDADIAHINSNTTNISNSTEDFYDGLIFQIERKELRDTEDFSGKFFVKISKNQVTDIIETGNPISILDKFQVTSKISSWYWEDKIDSNIIPGNANYGINNYNGHPATNQTSNNNIRHEDNVGAGNGTQPNGTVGLQLTDFKEPWQGIFDNVDGGPTFFVDSMHMVAGQSKASDYAKYCCVTWAGCTKNDGGDTLEDSAWSYPPVKTWLTDFEENSNLVQTLASDSIWYDNNLISTSGLLSVNRDYGNFRVDGWVGPLQKVSRDQPVSGTGINDANSVNGLEGFVTTNDVHAIGPRRWLSGITSGKTQNGVGNDTKTYSSDGEIGKHFMHLSFFAPGKDLHDNNWSGLTAPAVHGPTAMMANLQGIWGGGVFTGTNPDQKFGNPSSGDEEDKHFHLPMEGNYDSSNNFLPETPGPNVGQGYDTSDQPVNKVNCRELHERQWDPTFSYAGDSDNKIRDFIRNLYPGSQFRFHRVDTTPTGGSTVAEITDNTIYTIKNVTVKKLYNHTSWRRTYNRYIDNINKYGVDIFPSSELINYKSVEEAGLAWLNVLDENGDNTEGSPYTNAYAFRGKIVDFGAAHNRRVCYIIELDKNPTDSTSTLNNPLNSLGNPHPNAVMNGDLASDEYCDIEFLDPVKDILLSDLSKFPAIWEVDPKKNQVDLDIYYEASGNIPVKINEKTNELFAPLGCKVEVLNSSVGGTSILESWDGNIATFYPGLPKGDGSGEINYTGMSFKFIREDGGYTIADAGQQDLDGSSAGYKTEFVFREDISDNIAAGLSWYNCFSFSNGIESNRIKDDFNEPFISNGVKASTTIQEAYKEERRKTGLIYSGLYNSNSGVNDLNQFIMAEKITKDLNPTYGSIQKLFQRRISLIAFCEDRVIQITSNKDAIYNADGNPQLISSSNVLGDANPFVGDYGISKNPESFASESYRAYFTDKQRGSVIRLSKDGLTPISKAGMQSWFRDNLREYNSLIGTYDSYKEDYNLTLTNNPDFYENLISDSYLESGDTVSTLNLGSENKIQNPGVGTGTSLQYLYENNNVLEYENPLNPFDWSPFTVSDYGFRGNVQLTRHAAIGAGDLELGHAGSGGTPPAQTGNPFSYAVFQYSHTGLDDNGWFYDPNFDTATSDIFGPTAYTNRLVSGYNNYDGNKYSYVARFIDGTEVDEDDPTTHPAIAYHLANVGYVQAVDFDPSIEKSIWFPTYSGGTGNTSETDLVSQTITRTGSHGASYLESTVGAIVFDRVIDPQNTFVEFRDIGRKGYGLDGHLMDDFAIADGGVAGDIRHRTFYNGDELHVQFELECYPTNDLSNNASGASAKGYNYIKPKIQLMDGTNTISPDKIADVQWSANQQVNNSSNYNPYAYTQTSISSTAVGFTTSLLPAGSGYEDISGKYYSAKINTTNFAASAEYEFDKTDIISALTYNSTWGGGQSYNTSSVTVICSVSFKFQDDDVNNQSGDIIEAEVINDLRIRISNEEPRSADSSFGSGNDAYNSAGNYPMKGQLWEIVNLKIKKGFGVTAPHTEDTLYQAPNTDVIAAVTPVPEHYIPAWTEVTYDSNYGFGNNSWRISTTNDVYTERQGSGYYGSEYASVAQTGLKQNPDNSLPPLATDIIHYKVPQDWAHLASPGPTPNIIGSWTTASAYWNFDRTANLGDLTGAYPHNLHNYPNEYIQITTPGSGIAADIEFDVSSDPWVADGQTWYLVDVEFDDSFGAGTNTGLGGGADGSFHVVGASSTSGFSSGNPIDPNGVGLYSGSNTNSYVYLQQTQRTEYGNANGSGDNKTVLRGIFQVATDSWMESNNLNELRLRVYNCSNGCRIQKIITKKLTDPTTGSAWNNWLSNSGTTNSDWELKNNENPSVHSFHNKSIYYYNNKICWEIPDITAVVEQNINCRQYFSTIPSISNNGWEFKFTVMENPLVNTGFSGDFRIIVAGHDAGGNYEGVYLNGINQVGRYIAKFTFDGSGQVPDENGNLISWTFERANLGSEEFSDFTAIGGGIHVLSTTITWSPSPSDRIMILPESGQSVPQYYAINDFSLTDSTEVFTGGSADSWNFDGFDSSINDYIYWDSGGMNLVFNNCPISDGNESKFININQQVNETINQYEQYEVSFTHNIDPASFATLSIYYYNSNGFGFKISDINATSGNEDTDPISPTFGQWVYTEEVTIGSSEWSSVNILEPIFNPNLKNSFTIEVQGNSGETISGYIDNIRMVRVFNFSPDVSDTTVTFSEDVKGWTSFKDFIPENGVSVSKKYFTFNEGGLYQHYVPLKKNIGGNWVTGEDDPITLAPVKYTAEEAENYNVFYGDENLQSSIKAVLNQEPSLIKTFNTINYEGSQAYIKKPLDISDSSGNVVYSAASMVDINNAAAWGGDVLGWECSNIKTDLDHGSVIEFIQKEGKWFNYIKGKSASTVLDTSLFSVQGIGVISGVSDTSGYEAQPSSNGGGNGGNGGTGGNGGGY